MSRERPLQYPTQVGSTHRSRVTLRSMDRARRRVDQFRINPDRMRASATSSLDPPNSCYSVKSPTKLLYHIRSFPYRLKMADVSDTVVTNVTTFQHQRSNSSPIPSPDRKLDEEEEESPPTIPEDDEVPLSNGGTTQNSEKPPASAAAGVRKQNGVPLRTNSLGCGARTPPLERKSKFSAFGRLFKPWKWKRKKKSDKFEAASRSLERKISVRANRDELVQKGILLPESPLSPIQPTLPITVPNAAGNDSLQQGVPALNSVPATEPKKDKTDQANGSVASPAGETPPSVPQQDPPRPERPNTLGPGKLTRRLLCYHSEHCMSHSSPPRSSAVPPAITSENAPTDGSPVQSNMSEQRPVPLLSELPEPPIPVSEIGPIPPPPMFSSSPQPPMELPTFIYEDPDEDEYDEDEDEDADIDDPRYSFRVPQPDPSIDTSRVEEIPAKEPKFHAMPLKSALKKKGSGSGPGTPQNTPTQENRPLTMRQDHSSFNTRPVRFGIALPCTVENKENTRPYIIRDDTDSPVLYRDDGDMDEESRLAAKIARKDSLALKLALRPNRQELIARNIIHEESENERMETKEAIGARLIRRLSMRPTQEELEERNILKKQSAAEEKKMKEEKKRMLLRKLSFRPTVEELKEKKIIRFNDYIEVTQAHEYDRRADKPWTRLTPKDKAAIRKELNEFKSSEMEVHEDSRHLTRFHRP